MASNEEPVLLFSERIKKRLNLWWAVPGGLRNRSAWKRPWHRFLDTHRMRSHEWPLERWRCCSQWQRCLTNKWNSREFATLHQVPVPKLYWCGRNLSHIPIEQLPDRFAVRRVFGAASHDTKLWVNGRELLESTECTRQQLQADLIRQYGRWSLHPLLIEEFLADPAGQERTLECNCWCFGEKVVFIEQVEPFGRSSRRGVYDSQWRSLPDVIYSKRQRATPIPPLPQLTELLALASRLGKSFGTFVRVDFYVTGSNIYFGEFSSTPFGGRDITPWADEQLGQMWETHCPDLI